MARHFLAQKAPYSDTKIPYGRSKDEIENMLKEAGAIALRWTETPDSMKGVGLPVLEFILENKVIGEKGEVIFSEKIPVRLQPPLTDKSYWDKATHRILKVKNRNGSMRLLWWYVKARLEAAKFGLDDMGSTFMAKRILTLPDPVTGKPVSTTFAEVVRDRPEVLKGLLPSFHLDTDLLESKEPEVPSTWRQRAKEAEDEGQ